MQRPVGHSSFLASLAAMHLAERPENPWLAGILSQISDHNLIEAMKSGSRPVQHVAWLRMAELSEDQLRCLVLPNLNDDSKESCELTQALLRTMTHNSISFSGEICARVVSLMESNSREIQRAAATVIALREPAAALTWLRRHENYDRDVLRALCLADDPAMIEPLMRGFGFPGSSPPPTIGFVVTPVWLGDHHARYPEIVEWLITHCGYADDPVSPELLNLLLGGFSYVTDRMTSEPRVLKVAHRWQRRIRSFIWRLLPDELELQPDDDRPLDVDNPLDIDLFIAAVRDSDRLTFAERKASPPFSHEAMSQQLTPICFHASARYVRRLFVDEPLKLTDRWQIPAERKALFLIEHARVLLEPNGELRTAADRQLHHKWSRLL